MIVRNHGTPGHVSRDLHAQTPPLNGSAERQVIDLRGFVTFPDYSSDGSRIAFGGSVADGDNEIYVVDGYPWFPVANRLVRIDPATNRIDRVVEFATDEFLGFGSTIGFDAIWIGGLPGQVARVPISALKK